MTRTQRLVLVLTACALAWFCILTPRTMTYTDRYKTVTIKSGHHYFWEHHWDNHPIDYPRFVLQVAGVLMIGLFLYAAAGRVMEP